MTITISKAQAYALGLGNGYGLDAFGITVHRIQRKTLSKLDALGLMRATRDGYRTTAAGRAALERHTVAQNISAWEWSSDGEWKARHSGTDTIRFGMSRRAAINACIDATVEGNRHYARAKRKAQRDANAKVYS